MHIDHLRTVIGLRGYGQRDPLNEFKTEAFSLFEKLLLDLRQNVTKWLMTVEFTFQEPNYSVFDNWIHEPSYLCGVIAGRMTKSNTLGIDAEQVGVCTDPFEREGRIVKRRRKGVLGR